ncbi:MAG: ABC transporter permease [Candidatus Cloacimonetes bacterium]|nr:ABC transporter permease [Candidatus Cloacimonadota bacterium]
MKKFSKLAVTEFRLFLREPEAAFFTFIFPILMLFIFGSIYGNRQTEFFSGYGSVDASVPAYIAMIIATTGLLSISITVAMYRERGVLKRYRTTPLSSSSVMISQILVGFIMTLIGAVILIITAKLLYNLRFGGNVIDVAIAFILSSSSFFALGFLLAGIAPTARSANVIGMAIYFPNLFLSGATFPKQVFPAALDKISHFIPLRYVVEVMQGMWFGHNWSQHHRDVVILLVILVISVIISALTFRWE